MIKYLEPFLLSFLLSMALLSVAVLAAGKIPWALRTGERHIHRPGTYRIGGIIMVLVFNTAAFFNRDLFITPEIYSIMAGSLVLLVVGVWDDIKEIFWKIQFFFQVASAALVFIVGVRIYYVTNPLTGGIIKLDSGPGVILSVVLVIGWLALVMNALNWSDGIDGLSGGITFISAATIFFLSLKSEVNQPPVAILCSVLSGTVLAFLIFNFHPSRILAGTSGSMFMGFMVGTLAIIAGTKIATALLVMAVPIVDFLWVIGERIKNKKPFFRPDKNHLHYKLMELGWSQKKIAALYYVITIFIAAIALNTRVIGKSITLAITVSIMVIFYILIDRRIAGKKQEKPV